MAFVNWLFISFHKYNPLSIQVWSTVWRIVNFLQLWPASTDYVHHCTLSCVPTPMAVGWFWPLSIGFSLHTKKITHQASNFGVLFEELSTFCNFDQHWLILCASASTFVYLRPWLLVGSGLYQLGFHCTPKKFVKKSIQLSSIVWRIINFPQFLPASADSVHHRVQGGVPTPKLVGGFWHLGNVVSSVGSTIMICQVC